MIHQAFEKRYICSLYVLKLQSFDNKTRHLNLILLGHIIGEFLNQNFKIWLFAHINISIITEYELHILTTSYYTVT